MSNIFESTHVPTKIVKTIDMSKVHTIYSYIVWGDDGEPLIVLRFEDEACEELLEVSGDDKDYPTVSRKQDE